MYAYLDQILNDQKIFMSDKEKSEIYKFIFKNPGVSRKKIISKLELRPTSVSDDVIDLLSKGLVKEEGNETEIKRGRPEKGLKVNYNRFQVISIYAISTKVYGALFNLKKDIICIEEAEIPQTATNKVLHDIISNILTKLIESTKEEIEGISFAPPGRIDSQKRKQFFTARWPNIKNFNFSVFEKEFNLPVIVNPELKAKLTYLLIEEPKYAKHGTIMFHWGYGVGATYSYKGKFLHSDNSDTLDVGHMLYNPSSTKKCFCGKTGCVEAETAIWSLVDKFDVPKEKVPTDELEFQKFLLALSDEQIKVLLEPTQTIANVLYMLCKIFAPTNLILDGPFLTDDRIFDKFKENFYVKFSASDNVNYQMSRVFTNYPNKMFGGANSIVINSLNELILK